MTTTETPIPVSLRPSEMSEAPSSIRLEALLREIAHTRPGGGSVHVGNLPPIAIMKIVYQALKDPGPETITAIRQNQGVEVMRFIRSVMEHAWCAQTSRPKSEWSPEQPFRGQSDVTALFFQQLFDGNIARRNREDDPRYSNILRSTAHWEIAAPKAGLIEFPIGSQYDLVRTQELMEGASDLRIPQRLATLRERLIYVAGSLFEAEFVKSRS